MKTPSKFVQVACTGSGLANLDELNELQGELKTLSPADFEALRTQIVEQGFSFPFNVWVDEDGGKLWLLDGHQRCRTLKKMRENGWSIPKLPVCTVDAESMEQAKLKLLAAASQYGKTSEAGLAAFLKDITLDPVKLASDFPLPGLNMPKFIEINFPKSTDSGDMGAPSAPPAAGPAGPVHSSGVKMVHRVKQDGTISKTNRVPKGSEVESGVVGFLDRYPRIPFCRACAFNNEHPEAYAAIIPLAQEVSRVHAACDPVAHAFQKTWVDRTQPAFIIPDTVYTTVTVNKNFRTAAHRDANNLEDGTCSMILMREGQFTGGYVVFPEWRFAVAMDTGDLVTFRNMKDFHGNTKIVGLSENYQRCTLVFYYRDGMVHCGTPEQEIELAKNRKPGDSMS